MASRTGHVHGRPVNPEVSQLRRRVPEASDHIHLLDTAIPPVVIDEHPGEMVIAVRCRVCGMTGRIYLDVHDDDLVDWGEWR